MAEAEATPAAPAAEPDAPADAAMSQEEIVEMLSAKLKELNRKDAR